MRKRCWAVVGSLLLLGALTGSAYGQDLSSLSGDLQTLLGGIGEELLPSLLQNAVGSEGIGAASMGSSRFFAGLEGGATLASTDPLAVLGQSPDPFSIIDPQLLQANLGLTAKLQGFLSTAQKLRPFPYPQARLVAGVRPGGGFEIIAGFSLFPQLLTQSAAGFLGAANAGITFNTLGASLRVRKVLVSDSGPFPAISIGVGYAYTRLQVGYPLPVQSEPYYPSDTLTYGGTVALDAELNAVGVDLAFSKRLLIFTPFLRLSPWYEWASYTGSIDSFTYSLTDSSGSPVSGVTPPRTSTPSASETLRGLSFLVAGGSEIDLGGFALVPAGSFDLTTERFSASLSTRYQF